MTKYLLLPLTLLIATPAIAAEQYVEKGMHLRIVSPDGKYAVSDNDGGYVQVVDTQTGQTVQAFGTPDGWPYFFMGYGNAISNTGIVVGELGNDDMDTAVYGDITTGEVTPLACPDEWGANQAMGITPDGSVICGYVTNYSAPLEGTAKVAAIWVKGDDGLYGDCQLLPVPEKDWAGTIPYMIEAHWISDDGRTIVGMLTNAYSGMSHYNVIWPCVYTLDDEGNWNFAMIGEKMINPDNVAIPEYPTNYVPLPDWTQYMTEEEHEAYLKAYDEYDDEDDPTLEFAPKPRDFMSPEERERYDAAMEEYNAYTSACTAYDEAYLKAIEKMPLFHYLISMSPNAKYVGAFGGDKEETDFKNMGDSYIFNLENGDIRKISSPENVCVTQVFDDGTALGYYEPTSTAFEAQILLQGAEAFSSLYEWVAGLSTETAEWMTETMTHNILVDDEPADVMISGLPHASRDMSKIVSYAYNLWIGDPYDPEFMGATSYLINLGESVGVGSISDDRCLNEILATGEPFDIYSLDGSLLRRNADAEAIGSLAHGIYIIRTVSGSLKLRK